MDRLVQQQQAISKMMREQDNTPELFEVPKFLKRKKVLRRKRKKLTLQQRKLKKVKEILF